jgi:hypothetical protein
VQHLSYVRVDFKSCDYDSNFHFLPKPYRTSYRPHEAYGDNLACTYTRLVSANTKPKRVTSCGERKATHVKVLVKSVEVQSDVSRDYFNSYFLLGDNHKEFTDT